MTVFIFLSVLSLVCIQPLNAQGDYDVFLSGNQQFQPKQQHKNTLIERPSKEPPKTVNSNKNVNVILNVNSEEVAQRLWQIIQENLMKDPNKSSWVTQQQLKKVILPLVSSTRRGLTSVPITEIGEKLEKITRRALIMDDPGRPPMDREILTRDIVADMMSTIKNVVPNGQELTENIPAKRMLEFTENSPRKSQNNRYATLEVKIQRRDILNIIRPMLSDSGFN